MVQGVETVRTVRDQDEQNGCKSLLWRQQRRESESKTLLPLWAAPISALRTQHCAHAIGAADLGTHPTSDIWNVLCVCAIAWPTLELYSSGWSLLHQCAVSVCCRPTGRIAHGTLCLRLPIPLRPAQWFGLASGHVQRWLKPLCLELRSELASQALLVRPSSVGPSLAPALRGRRRSSWRSTAWRSRMYTHGSRIWFHDARRTARKSGRCRELEFQPPTANTTNTCEKSRCEQWSPCERRGGV